MKTFDMLLLVMLTDASKEPYPGYCWLGTMIFKLNGVQGLLTLPF